MGMLLALVAFAAAGGCGDDARTSCVSGADCDGGMCVDGVCRPAAPPDGGRTAGDASDVGPPDAGGALCGAGRCNPGEICRDERCQCDGDPCESACCTGDSVCYLGRCEAPGRACTASTDCAPDGYCEFAIGRCLPSAGREPCEYRPPVGVFSPVLAWSWPQAGTPDADVYQIISTPLVVPLEPAGPDPVPVVPAVVFLAGRDIGGGELRAVRGDTGEDLFHVTGVRFVGQSHPAAGDLDGDGRVEIVGLIEGTSSYCGYVGLHEGARLAAFSADGTRLWTSAETVSAGAGAPAIADLDADGRAEVVVGDSVFGADGVRRWVAGGGAGIDGCSQAGAYSIVADVVPGATGPEVIVGARAYDRDGRELWRGTEGGAPVRDGMPAVADLDLDGTPEVVVVHGGSGGVSVLDGATGARRCGFPAPAAGIGGGPPVIADFDGDGTPDIGVVFQHLYVALRGDCTELWRRAVDDDSGQTSSSVFDFDGDGRSEVVYTDETQVLVFGGADGSIRFTLPHRSATGLENPVVADIDADGHTEIVTVGQQLPSIEAFRDAERKWVASRPIWNQHAYHVTNVAEDGRIPRTEMPSWEDINGYRINAAGEQTFDVPNLAVVDLAVGTAGCPGEVRAFVRVVNRGARGVLPPVRVVVTLLRGGAEVATAETATTRVLLPGESERLEVGLPLEPGVTDGYEVQAEVDPPGGGFGEVRECNEDDNAAGPVPASCAGPE